MVMKTWQKWALLLVVVFGLIVCIRSCMIKKEPDITIAYIGAEFVNTEKFEKSVTSLEKSIEDINSDGDVNIELMEISFNESLGYADKSNSSQKLANAVGMGTARVYIIDKEYVLKNKDSGVFANVAELGDGIETKDGLTIAVSLEGNKKVREMGIEPKEGLYLAIRKVTEIDQASDKSIHKKDAAAWHIAKYILAD